MQNLEGSLPLKRLSSENSLLGLKECYLFEWTTAGAVQPVVVIYGPPALPY